MRERYKIIARVEKPHGKKGEVVTVPVHGLPAVVREGMTVAVVPPLLKRGRWHKVLSVEQDARAGSLVALSGVRSLADADELAGRYLLASREELPEGIDLMDADLMVGREVVLDDGPARVDQVMRGPANDVWVLRRGPLELLLPVVAGVVAQDARTGAVTAHVPAGLEWEEA